jgi:hypothetical protein
MQKCEQTPPWLLFFGYFFCLCLDIIPSALKLMILLPTPDLRHCIRLSFPKNISASAEGRLTSDLENKLGLTVIVHLPT